MGGFDEYKKEGETRLKAGRCSTKINILSERILSLRPYVQYV